MATIVDFFGACGLAIGTSPGAAYSWHSSGAATSITVDATAGRAGKPTLKLQATAAGVNPVGFNVAAGNRKVVAFGWLKMNQAPTLSSATFIQGTGPATNPGIQITTAGILRAFAGANVQNYSGTLTVGQWYFICALIDCSTTTFSIAWKVFDETAGTWTAQTTCSTAGGDTAADILTIKFGNNASAAKWGDVSNVGCWFGDIGFSVTSADHPIAPVETRLLKPTGCGTHSLGSGLFTKTGSVAITGGETTSWQEIDEQPPVATDWVAQTAIDAAAFVEYTRGWAAAETRDPIAVKFYTEHQGAATGAYTMEVRARQNSVDSADITSGGTKSATTIVRRALCLALAPDGTAWTNTKASTGTVVRFGYSGDATPDAQLNGVFSEALLAVPMGTTLTNTTTATAGSSASILKRPGRIAAPSSAGTTITALKTPALIRSVSGASAATVLKIPKLIRAVTGGASAIALQTRIKVTEVSIAIGTATITVLKTLLRVNATTATAGSTPTITKRPARTTSTSATNTSTALKAPVHTASTTGSSTATVVRKPALVRAVTAASTASAQQAKVTLLAVTRTATNALTTLRAVTRTTTAAAGSTITVLAARTRVRLASIAATATATITKAPALIRALTASSAPTATKRPSLTRSISATSTATATKAPGRVASVTAAATASTSRAVGRLASIAAGSATSLRIGAARTATTIATSSASALKSAAVTTAAAATWIATAIATAIANLGLIGRKGRSNRTQGRATAPSIIDAITANPGQGETRATADRTGETTYHPATSDGIIEGGDG